MNEYLNIFNHWELTLGDIAVDTFKTIRKRQPTDREVYYLTHPNEISKYEPNLQAERRIIIKYYMLPFHNITLYTFIFNSVIFNHLIDNKGLFSFLRKLSGCGKFNLNESLQTLDEMNLPDDTAIQLLYRDIFNFYTFNYCNDEIFALSSLIQGKPTIESLQQSKEENLRARNQRYFDSISPESRAEVDEMFQRRKQRDLERRMKCKSTCIQTTNSTTY